MVVYSVVQVEQPHVNVLSKVDLIEKYGKLPFNLDFFTEVLDLSYLLEHFPVSYAKGLRHHYNRVLLPVFQTRIQFSGFSRVG
jgi:hypothetical protein